MEAVDNAVPEIPSDVIKTRVVERYGQIPTNTLTPEGGGRRELVLGEFVFVRGSCVYT